MVRIYRVPFAAATVTNAGGNNDLWTITPADDKPVHIVGLRLGQISEVGDSAEEGIDITIEHLGATVTAGTGGSAVTPVPRDPGISDLAAGFTARINDTGVATTSGTKTVMEPIPWNNRNTPFEVWWPDIDYAPTARQASALVVRMNTTIADDMTFSGCLFVAED
jgi:hypothetical protein